MKAYSVIMAGGSGTRFWPLSRRETPKQLINLTGNDLLINETIERITKIIDCKDTFIVTNKTQIEKMKLAVQERIPETNILSEPSMRNTAACIGFAAVNILKKFGDGIMCVFPSDHYIEDTEKFSQILKSGIDIAKNTNKLITIGITPTFPATGYGYIKYNKNAQYTAKEVLAFKEKPDSQTAKSYYISGEYVWNSGIFIWKVSTILSKIKCYLPDIYNDLIEIKEWIGTDREMEVIERIYPKIRKESIDYGIMEKSDDIMVIPGNFGWNDVGSWDMLSAINNPDENNNIIIGDQINIDTMNCISYSSNRLISTLGVKDLIIVEHDNAILICDRRRAQDIKDIVAMIEQRGTDEFL